MVISLAQAQGCLQLVGPLLFPDKATPLAPGYITRTSGAAAAHLEWKSGGFPSQTDVSLKTCSQGLERVRTGCQIPPSRHSSWGASAGVCD